VIDKYQPDYLWFDFGWREPEFEPYKKKFLAYYYNQALNWNKEVVVTYKHEDLPLGVAVLDLERGKLDTLSTDPWITDTSIDFKSWSYISKPNYKPVNMLVDNLVDRVSKNGNLLLNIGPHPDGSIPEEQKELLLGIGEWLKVNGEAIYGTRPWILYGEGPTKGVGGYFSEEEGDFYTARDIRYTTKEDAYYVIALDWPEDGRLLAAALNSETGPGEIKSVSMLGSDSEIVWTQDAKGLTIYFPKDKPCEHAFAFKLEI
jgi:alpha-L-fucosidase